jgi:hypothetical protein
VSDDEDEYKAAKAVDSSDSNASPENFERSVDIEVSPSKMVNQLAMAGIRTQAVDGGERTGLMIDAAFEAHRKLGKMVIARLEATNLV